jgi:hypothetical protein
VVIGEKFHRIEWNELATFHAAKPGDVFGHRIAPFFGLHNEELTNLSYSKHVRGDPGTP